MDWETCAFRSDRLFEVAAERLRNHATLALAIGLLSTFFMLSVAYFGLLKASSLGTETTAYSALTDTLKSLIGSGIGVLSHLLIVIFVLHRCENVHARWTNRWEARLERLGRKHPPSSPLVSALRDEMRALRESLTIEFAREVSGSVKNLPSVFEELTKDVRVLSTTVAKQSETLGSTMSEVNVSLSLMAKSAASLEPLVEATNTSRHTSELTLRSMNDVRQTFIEVHSAFADLPKAFSVQIELMADRLGAEFGREAQQSNLMLTDALQSWSKELVDAADERDRQAVNRIGTLVTDLFEGIGLRIDEKLGTSVREASDQLAAVAAAMPKVTEKLEAANHEWSEQQIAFLASWKETAASVEGAATKLRGDNGLLQRASTALGQSAENLEEVANATRGLLGEVLAKQGEFVGRVTDKTSIVLEKAAELLSRVERFQGIWEQEHQNLLRSIEESISRIEVGAS